jgi:uncharacterized protein YebE (UPF0316 family)
MLALIDLDHHAYLLPLLIFTARVADVSIGTFRLICVTRGRRGLAVLLGAFEVTIWLLAISGVFAYLHQWWNVIAYVAGFTTGNAVGMAIEKRLAMGTQLIRFISRGPANAVAERLRFAEQVVTTVPGRGRDGPVSVCLAVVPRRKTDALIRMAREIDPDVVVTVEDTVQTVLHCTDPPRRRLLFPAITTMTTMPPASAASPAPTTPSAPTTRVSFWPWRRRRNRHLTPAA